MLETVYFALLGIDTKEKIAKQRQLLNARLGLDMVENFGVETNALFTNEDLISTPEKYYNDTKVIDTNNDNLFNDFLIPSSKY